MSNEASPHREPASAVDWGNRNGDLDVEHAFKTFAGKSYEGAIALFGTTDILSRVEDLSVMPEAAFRFYLLAFRDFVMSDRLFKIDYGWNAASAADTFLSLVLRRVRDAPASILPVLDQLMPAVRHVTAHQSDFDADEGIYGSFQTTLAQIEAIARTHKSE